MKAFRRGLESASCALLLAVIGCGGESADLDPAAEPSAGDETEINAAAPSLEGTWTATVASPAFVSGAKPLRLELDATGRGALLVGEERLPPPSDPEIGWPPEANADAGEATGMLLHLYEGVEYSLSAVRNGDAHLYFELNALEAFEPSCAIAIPRPTELGYRCMENWGGGVERFPDGKRCNMTDPASGEVREVDCLMLYLCSMDPILGCRCTESSCRMSNSGSPIRARFDLELSADGTSLVGSHQLDEITGDLSSLGDVTFTREAD